MTRPRFPWKSIERGWVGATEGKNKEVSTCGSCLRASLCGTIDRWWGRCCWLKFPVLTKVFCLMDALKMRGSYEMVEKVWAQSVPTAGRINAEVVWTRDEVVVGSVNFGSHFISFFQIYIVVLLSVNLFNKNAAQNFVTRGWVGSSSPFLQFRAH